MPSEAIPRPPPQHKTAPAAPPQQQWKPKPPPAHLRFRVPLANVVPGAPYTVNGQQVFHADADAPVPEPEPPVEPNPWANYQASGAADWETLQPDTGIGPCPDDDPEYFGISGYKGRSDKPGRTLVVENVWEDIGRFRTCGSHCFVATITKWCRDAGVPCPSWNMEALRNRSDFGSIRLLMTYKSPEDAKLARRKIWGWWGDCPKEFQELGFCFYTVRFWSSKRPARMSGPPVQPMGPVPGPPPGPPPADAMGPPPRPAENPAPQEPEELEPQEPEPQEPHQQE